MAFRSDRAVSGLTRSAISAQIRNGVRFSGKYQLPYRMVGKMSGLCVRQARNPAENDQFSVLLDFIRSISALMVCLAHTRNLMFPDYSEIGSQGLFVKAFYFFTLFGSEAVIIFFVMSGLLVGGSIVREAQRCGTLNFKYYYISRFSRLGVALYPAIILSILLQVFGFGKTCSDVDGVRSIIFNVFYLQNLASEPLCNNHPLWSISNEMFYYVTAPIILILMQKEKYGFLGLILVGIAALTFLNPSSQGILFGYFLWIAGTLVVFMRIPVSYLIPGFGLVLILIASRTHLFPNYFISDISIAIIFATFLMSRFPRQGFSKYFVFFSKNFSAFSYSLYLIHMPVAQAVASIMPKKLDPTAGRSYLIFSIVIFSIVLIAFIFGKIFEGCYPIVRKILIERVTGRLAE